MGSMSLENFPRMIMGALLCILMLGAVVLPIMGAIPTATGPYADIINLLISIVPVVLLVVVIIMIMYMVIGKRD